MLKTVYPAKLRGGIIMPLNVQLFNTNVKRIVDGSDAKCENGLLGALLSKQPNQRYLDLVPHNVRLALTE